MRFYASLLFLFLVKVSFGQYSNTSVGHEIKVQIKPLKGIPVYLGHYAGNEYTLVDTVQLNEKSEAVFKGGSTLPGGIYFIGYPGQPGNLDILIDKGQHFSINIDAGDRKFLLIKFANSPENDLFNDYQHYMAARSVDIASLRRRLDNSTTGNDSSTVIHQLSDIDKEIQKKRNEIIDKDPASLLSSLLIALRDPELPQELKIQRNKTDSVKAQSFIQNHYWDGIHFWDGRLVYTPFFESKLDKYLKEVIDLRSDSVSKELDRMLAFAGGNDIMMKFLLPKLLYGSMYHKYKWDDAVYIHLFEKFVANRSYSWLSDNERKIFTQRAYFLMGNTKGKVATDIQLPGIDGKKLSLLNVPATYTVLCFWDPTCHHCIETLPKLDSIYRSKWKQAGIKLFSVAVETDGTKEGWIQYINNNNLGDWANVYNSFESEKELAATGKRLYLQDYDVWYYPSFFLLDNEKRLMAKKLNYTQMVDLVESVLSKK